jgi:hypothetical protein
MLVKGLSEDLIHKYTLADVHSQQVVVSKEYIGFKLLTCTITLSSKHWCKLVAMFITHINLEIVMFIVGLHSLTHTLVQYS